ncbi:MAG: hypothetical protein KDK64_07045 [Chlamydiia bacterium]|nr:hypothetical protein [Chlamydiia bacterium]
MSTDINTQNPPPSGQPAQGASNGSGVSVVGFQAGNAANTMAVLLLIADLMKLSEFKNDLFTTQAQAASNVADDYSDSQIQLGNQEMTELEIQGAFSGAMGLVTAGLGAAGMFEEMNVQNLEGETNATQDFVNKLDNKGSSGSIEDEGTDEPVSTNPAENEKVTESDDLNESKDTDEEMDEDDAVNAETQQLRAQIATEERTEEIQEESGSSAIIESEEAPNNSENKGQTKEMKARFEKMLEEIKDGSYKMTDGQGKSAKAAPLKGAAETKQTFSDEEVVTTCSESQLEQLKAAGNDRVTSMNNKLAEAKQTLRMNFDKRQMASSANQGIMQGAGNIGAGIMKQQEGEQQADNTQYDAAQKQFQNLTQETEKQADQDVQSADSLIQLIQDLDKSNGANLTA